MPLRAFPTHSSRSSIPFSLTPCTLPSFFDSSTSRDQDCVSPVPLSLLRAFSIFLSRVMRLAEGEGKKEENKPWKRNLSSTNTITPFPFSKISYIDLYSRKGAARTGWASARPAFKSAAWRDARWIHPRVFRSATLGPRRASQCSAAGIKQAAIHGATVSRLRVIAGPVPASSTETKKRGTVGGRGEGDSEEAERRREFSRGRARNRRSKGRRDATGEKEREKVEVEERVDRGGIEDRREEKNRREEERRKKSGELVQQRVIHGYTRGRVRETGPLEISPDSLLANRAREKVSKVLDTPLQLDFRWTRRRRRSKL